MTTETTQNNSRVRVHEARAAQNQELKLTAAA